MGAQRRMLCVASRMLRVAHSSMSCRPVTSGAPSEITCAAAFKARQSTPLPTVPRCSGPYGVLTVPHSVPPAPDCTTPNAVPSEPNASKPRTHGHCSAPTLAERCSGAWKGANAAVQIRTWAGAGRCGYYVCELSAARVDDGARGGQRGDVALQDPHAVCACCNTVQHACCNTVHHACCNTVQPACSHLAVRGRAHVRARGVPRSNMIVYVCAWVHGCGASEFAFARDCASVSLCAHAHARTKGARSRVCWRSYVRPTRTHTFMRVCACASARAGTRAVCEGVHELVSAQTNGCHLLQIDRHNPRI